MQTVGQQDFQAVRKTRVSEGIIGQIRDLVTSGRLRPGDRLPAERDLARILGVGRSTVREAIRGLESLGILQTRAGEGTFLSAVPATNTDILTARLFESWDSQRKLFEVRQVIEPDLAALAARRATADQIAGMQKALAEQEQLILQGGTGIQADTAFHYLLAEAAGNELLLKIMDNLMGLLKETRETSLQGDRPPQSLKQHRAILSAIEARDADAAQRRMERHIRSMEERVFALRTASLPDEQPPTGASR
jgi:GntR family transcriptional repressor for pyruvate dehydrogenase complex